MGYREKTLVLLKPDAIQRGIVGEIINRIEKKGLKLVGCKMVQLDKKILREHYAHLVDKPFYPRIEVFMSSSPVVAMVWEGLEAVRVLRNMSGATNARDAAVGTIRGDYGVSGQANLIHASDSVETAKKEINRFFSEKELFEYERELINSVYSQEELGKKN